MSNISNHQSCKHDELQILTMWRGGAMVPWCYGGGVWICVSAETLLCNVTSLVSCTLIKPKHDACFTWRAKIRIISQLGLYLSSNSRPCCVILNLLRLDQRSGDCWNSPLNQGKIWSARLFDERTDFQATVDFFSHGELNEMWYQIIFLTLSLMKY